MEILSYQHNVLNLLTYLYKVYHKNMKQYISFFVALILTLLLSSCTSSSLSVDAVPYEIADHYFYRNDAPQTDNPIVCKTLEEFEQYYGYAAVMGKGGQPTPIDFSKQFTMAIVLPITNHTTEIHPTDLQLNDGILTLHYTVQTEKEEMTSSMCPMILLILDKKYEDKAVSFQIQQD